VNLHGAVVAEGVVPMDCGAVAAFVTRMTFDSKPSSWDVTKNGRER
jgi:hypothetical protein